MSYMQFNVPLIVSILCWLTVIELYYRHIKKHLLNLALKIATRLKLSRRYTLQQTCGVVELILIAISHALLCIILLYILGFTISAIGLKMCDPSLILLGILLGIGQMSFSSIVCLLFICILQKIFPREMPQEAESWNTIAKGGWIRHHLHIINTCSPFIALPVIFLQISCEEIVFRGIIQNYFLIYGNMTAAFISIVLFVYMQTFHMPSRISAMFPVIGSLVMGIVHSYLFIEVPMLLPLIVAHISFFIMSVYVR